VLDSSNRVHIRNVLIGLEGQQLVEIASGLEPGERVIVGGQDKYQEGETVNPIMTNEPPSETMHETGGTIDIKGEEAEQSGAQSAH
jgi:hypothetical protein